MTQEAVGLAPSSIYKYVDMARLRRILQGSIRFTQPSAFNDPFELLPEIVMPVDEPERPIRVSFDIMAKRRHPPVGEVENVPDQCGASDATSRDIVQQLNSLIGILCLSRRNDSLLMWSHYADQYAGAVIEFDGSHKFFAGQVGVEYRSQRPKKHLSVYSVRDEPVPVSELCAKSDQWEYESEIRVIRCLSECEIVGEDPRGFPVYIQRIPIESIKSVILGERTKVSEQKEIYALVKDTKIALSLAAIDHSGYAFRHEQIKFGVPVSQVGPIMSPRTAHIFSDSQSPLGETARWMIEKHPMSKIVNKPV
jgi:Protein of unknown function (DUF2971)